MSKKVKNWHDYQEDELEKITWQDVWHIVRILLPGLIWLFGFSLLGKWNQKIKYENSIRQSYEKTYDPSKKLGVEPPPEHPMKLNWGKYNRSNTRCLTSEELQENI